MVIGGDDARLVADIEKLIKKKIELEPIEFDDDRPRRAAPPRASATTATRRVRASAPRPARATRRRAPPSDPFFDQPYEAERQRRTPPAWERRAQPRRRRRGLSPNIKPKKKVAALLGGR